MSMRLIKKLLYKNMKVITINTTKSIINFKTTGVGEDVKKPVAYVFLMSIGGQGLEENKKHSGKVS